MAWPPARAWSWRRTPTPRLSAIRAAMVDRAFGDAGAQIVLEECLVGPEVSFFVVADGEAFRSLLTAQDHKRIFDGDEGPNTGGMGAFCPSPLVDIALQQRIEKEIVTPVLAGMASEGNPFRGFLYCGLMLTADGPEGHRVQRPLWRPRSAGGAATDRRASGAIAARGGRRPSERGAMVGGGHRLAVMRRGRGAGRTGLSRSRADRPAHRGPRASRSRVSRRARVLCGGRCCGGRPGHELAAAS